MGGKQVISSSFAKLCLPMNSSATSNDKARGAGDWVSAAMVTWWTSKSQPCTYKIALQFKPNSHGGALSAVNISKHCLLYCATLELLAILSGGGSISELPVKRLSVFVCRRPRDNRQEAIFFRRYLPIYQGSGSFHSSKFQFTCQGSSVVAKTLVDTLL